MIRPHALLPLLAMSTVGCEQISDFLPKVAFDGLEVRAIDWEEADVDFVFSVSNPNPVRVGLSSFDYDLDLEDVDFIEGDNPDGFTLAANGSAPLVLPLDLRYEDIWNTIEAIRGEDVVDFGLSGRMGFNTPGGEVKLPYDESGGFPALRIPKFRFQALRVTDVNPLAPKIEIDLGVDNELGSSLFFDRFDYAVSLNDDDVAGGIVQTFEALGATESVLTLPIDLDPITALGQIGNALFGGGALDVGLIATMDVDTPFGIVPLTIDEKGNLDVDL